MKLDVFLSQPFTFFNTSSRKWQYVISSAVFALVFLILFQPYGLSEEISNPINSNSSIFLFFVSICISSFIGLSLSQFKARKWFNFEEVTVKRYIYWFFIEALVMTLINFAFSFVIPDLGNDFENELSVIFQVKVYFKTIFILLFPFLGCILYSIIKDLNYEINELEEQLEGFRFKFDNKQKEEQIIFKDENNNNDFSIELKNFLFAESSNQYILIYYLLDGEVKRQIVRNRMKNFLAQINGLPIIQCHRSYSVNLLNVKHKTKREGKHFLAVNVLEPMFVPVSKSYSDLISKSLS